MLSTSASPTREASNVAVRETLAARVRDGTAQFNEAEANLSSMGDKLREMELAFAEKAAALRELRESSTIASAIAASRDAAAAAVPISSTTSASPSSQTTSLGLRVRAKARITGITRDQFEDPTNPVRLAFLALMAKEASGGSPVEITRVRSLESIGRWEQR